MIYMVYVHLRTHKHYNRLVPRLLTVETTHDANEIGNINIRVIMFSKPTGVALLVARGGERGEWTAGNKWLYCQIVEYLGG